MTPQIKAAVAKANKKGTMTFNKKQLPQFTIPVTSPMFAPEQIPLEINPSAALANGEKENKLINIKLIKNNFFISL